jgi:predicted negative regulator of RcsB-dependent stress response
MWTAISSVLTVLSLLGSAVAIFWAVRSVAAVQELQRASKDYAPQATELLKARVDELEATTTLLANKLKMTRVRNAITHVRRGETDEPDARLDPEAWRRWKNAQLRAGEFNQ